MLAGQLLEYRSSRAVVRRPFSCSPSGFQIHGQENANRDRWAAVACNVRRATIPTLQPPVRRIHPHVKNRILEEASMEQSSKLLPLMACPLRGQAYPSPQASTSALCPWLVCNHPPFFSGFRIRSAFSWIPCLKNGLEYLKRTMILSWETVLTTADPLQRCVHAHDRHAPHMRHADSPSENQVSQ